MREARVVSRGAWILGAVQSLAVLALIGAGFAVFAGEAELGPPTAPIEATIEASWSEGEIVIQGTISNVSEDAVHVVTYGYEDPDFGFRCMTPNICGGCDCDCRLVERHQYDLPPGSSCTYLLSYCALHTTGTCDEWTDPLCIHERPTPGSYPGSWSVFGVPGIEIPDPVVLGENGLPSHWRGFVPQRLLSLDFTLEVPEPDAATLRDNAGPDLAPPRAIVTSLDSRIEDGTLTLRLPLQSPHADLSGELSYASQPVDPDSFETLRFTWSLVDGPAPVAFSAPDSIATEVLFSAPGDYEIALRVEDGYHGDCGEYFFALGGEDTATVHVTVLSSPFRRGDVNDDTAIDISDVVTLLLILFGGGSPIACPDAGDVDDSGTINVTDAIGLLGYLFRAGLPPAFPFRDCGDDPGLDALDCRASVNCIVREG